DLAAAAGKDEDRALPERDVAGERPRELDEVHYGAPAQVAGEVGLHPRGEPLARVRHVVAQVEENTGTDRAEQNRAVGEAQTLEVDAGEGAVEGVEAAGVLDLVGLELETERPLQPRSERELETGQRGVPVEVVRDADVALVREIEVPA